MTLSLVFPEVLKQGWAKKKVQQPLDDAQNTEDRTALINYWYSLAREFGYCSGLEFRDGEEWVCMSGTWKKFTAVWERGYNLDYLRKVKARTTNL